MVLAVSMDRLIPYRAGLCSVDQPPARPLFRLSNKLARPSWIERRATEERVASRASGGPAGSTRTSGATTAGDPPVEDVDLEVLRPRQIAAGR